MITKPLLAGSVNEVTALSFPMIATPKLDGIRVLKVNGKVVTRKFKDLPNRYVREQLEKLLPDGIDGEVMLQPENTFNEIQSEIMRFEGEPKFTFHAFDYVKDDISKPYIDRLEDLAKWHATLETDVVKIVPSITVDDDVELLEFEMQCLEMGYEGIMLRNPQGKYKCGRSTLKEQILLKLKRFSDAEALVLGFDEKMTNTNTQEKDVFGRSKRSSKKEGMVAADTLGSLLVKDLTTSVEFGLGSGFSDELKAEIWNNKDKYLNKIVKYKYQECGAKDLPRFPVFLGFRHEDDM